MNARTFGGSGFPLFHHPTTRSRNGQYRAAPGKACIGVEQRDLCGEGPEERMELVDIDRGVLFDLAGDDHAIGEIALEPDGARAKLVSESA